MRSFSRNLRYPSACSNRSISLGTGLLALAVSACGGADPAQSSKSGSSTSALVASAPSLGSAANFAVLAGTAVTCTDGTIAGNVGVFPGVTITQTNCPVTGTLHAGDTVAAQAQKDFLTAYDAFAALPCDRTLTTLDGLTLSPGVYCFDAAATSTGGVLTLDGPANGNWIFKVGTLGTGALTGTNFSVVTKAGTAPACNSVYWWVSQAVTMTDSKFVGTILAGTSITLTRGTFNGDALAKVAATVTGTKATACAAAGGGGGGGGCDEKDSVTGGGEIKDSESGDKASFGVAGGTKGGKLSGHLNYVDHGRKNLKVHGKGITGYAVLASNTRRINGTAKVNGQGGFTYQVDVTDNGEPGRNDTFSIHLFNAAGTPVYTAASKLEHGNIKLHKSDGDDCEQDGDDEDSKDDHGGNDDGNEGGGD